MDIATCNGAVPGNISRLIAMKGYKQGAVAKRAGMTEHQLCDMLKGRKLIKIYDLVCLADALEVPIQEFFK